VVCVAVIRDSFSGLKHVPQFFFCARMPLVLTTTLAVGSQDLAKDNAVVQRFSAIPEMAGMDLLCSHK
jgi:hypothetical protein